jgi:hypothetical protein
LTDGKASGPFVVFADGFAGATKNRVRRRTGRRVWRSDLTGLVCDLAIGRATVL